jgi:hypothetical protein
MTEDLCLDCGLPREDHETDYDYALDDRKAFDRAVAKRVEEKLAEHRYVAALVEWKMAQARGDSSVPKPRSPAVDAAELALIEARDFRARVDHRVAQMIQESRGADGEYVTPSNAPTREAWLAGLGKSVADCETKDRAFETRDA